MPPIADLPAPLAARRDQDAPDVVALVVAELASSRRARQLVATIASKTGLAEDATRDALLEAERGGWVELWPDAPRGPSAMLSARSAERLGLRLSADSRRWLTARQVDRSHPGTPNRFMDENHRLIVEADYSDPDGPGLYAPIADPFALEGLDSIVLVERAALMALEYETTPPPPPETRKRPKGSCWSEEDWQPPRLPIPKPSLLLGQSPIWPVRYTPHGPCPGCKSDPMGFATYCLICGRSGVDHLLPEAVPLPPGPGPDELAEMKRVKEARRQREAARRRRDAKRDSRNRVAAPSR